jgi:hypothetical protein
VVEPTGFFAEEQPVQRLARRPIKVRIRFNATTVVEAGVKSRRKTVLQAADPQYDFSVRSPIRNMTHSLPSSGLEPGILQRSSLYREFLAEKDEILKHKWIESEKVGYDIGFEAALVDWITKHRASWRRARTSGTLT